MNWCSRILWPAVFALGLTVAQSQTIPGQTVTGFRLPEYNPDGSLRQQLYGETATFLPEGIIHLTGLRIEFFRGGEMTARVLSPECAYDPNRKRAASRSPIRIITKRAILTGRGYAWNAENEQFQIFQEAKVVLDSRLDKDLLAPATPPAAPAEKDER